MLKLYTDKSFLTEIHRRYVFPLLFDLYYVKNDALFDYYKLVDSVADCDIVVFPIDYSSFYVCKEAFARLNKVAKTHDKPIWLYTSGDFGYTVDIPNSYNFRLGGFDSKLDSNTFMLPSFVDDPYDSILKQLFSVLPKDAKPSIGFVGHAKSGFIKYIRSYLSHLKLSFRGFFGVHFFDKQSYYPSGIKRAQYLNKLGLSKELNTDFAYRNTYRAGATNQKTKLQTTEEFYKNIFNNLYTFCIRGVGNFSVRFYETLATGRIPVLLNTDCRLPLSNRIDWKKHAVILDESKKESLELQILHFHNLKSNKEIEELQKKNRLLWETHLMRHSYFIKVHNIFADKLKNNV